MLIEGTPNYQDWVPRQNCELLLELAEKTLKEPRKQWFKTNIMEGTAAEGPMLHEIGVTKNDFQDPKKMAKLMADNTKDNAANLSVIIKMLNLRAIAQIPRGLEPDAEVYGTAPIFMKGFFVHSKGKPRYVTNYASKTNRVIGEEYGLLPEWLEDATNRKRWEGCKGRPSFNFFMEREDTTLGYTTRRDLASQALAFGVDGKFTCDDISGSYYQIRQRKERLPYQMKVLHAKPVGSFPAKTLSFLLMTREMGDASACAVGNADTGTKILLAEEHAKSNAPGVKYRYKWDELVKPSAYGLKDYLPIEYHREILKKNPLKKRNRNEFMHNSDEAFVQFRFGKRISAVTHFQDDIRAGVLGSTEDPAALCRHVHYFFDEIDVALSTEPQSPKKITIFCGTKFRGPFMGFAEEKWARYSLVVDRLLNNEESTGAEIMQAGGILANTGCLFPWAKPYFSVFSHHVGKIIRVAIESKNHEQLKRQWNKLLETSFPIDPRVKRAVKKGWFSVKGKEIHARRFALCAGDARYRVSIDACPLSPGMVSYQSLRSFGADWRNSTIMTRPAWKKPISSTGFEVAASALAMDVVPVLKRVHTDEWPTIIVVDQDNFGAITALHPSKPKFRGDYLAPNMLIQELCRKRKIVLVPKYCGTKVIPADVPSRFLAKNAHDQLVSRLAKAVLLPLCARLPERAVVRIFEFFREVRKAEVVFDFILILKVYFVIVFSAPPIEMIPDEVIRRIGNKIQKLEKRY